MAVVADNNNNKQVFTGLLDRGCDSVVTFCGLTLSTPLSLISAWCFLVAVPVELWFVVAGFIEVPFLVD